jgi:hypothetical protein
MKRDFFYKSCLKKKRYSTIKVAQQVKNKVFKERGLVLNIYHCDICNGYHLTKLILDK